MLTSPTAPKRPVRVLMVEDSEDILFIMKTELEWMGYALDVAKDGYTGLALAKASYPDVVVSDIRMPGIDGFEFIRQIREIPGLATVPAIALTGLEMDHDGEQPLALGFTAQMTKPVEPAELSSVIQQLTASKKFKRAS